jgi:hypothetical protein
LSTIEGEDAEEGEAKEGEPGYEVWREVRGGERRRGRRRRRSKSRRTRSSMTGRV